MANYNLAPSANITGTSYHGDFIHGSEADLRRLFGAPHNTGDYGGEWTFQDAETGSVITLYKDVKNWHIGGRSKAITSHFKKEIRAYLEQTANVIGSMKKTPMPPARKKAKSIVKSGYEYLGKHDGAYFWKNERKQIVFNNSGRLTDTVMFYRPGKGHPAPPRPRYR